MLSKSKENVNKIAKVYNYISGRSMTIFLYISFFSQCSRKLLRGYSQKQQDSMNISKNHCVESRLQRIKNKSRRSILKLFLK